VDNLNHNIKLNIIVINIIVNFNVVPLALVILIVIVILVLTLAIAILILNNYIDNECEVDRIGHGISLRVNGQDQSRYEPILNVI